MFTRGVNEDGMKAEGLNTPPPKTAIEEANTEPHKMSLWYSYADPHRKRGAPRPTVDVSTPFTALDETHQARRFGEQKLGYGFLSMNEFIGTHEEVPYTSSHHTSEIVKLWMVALNVYQLNRIQMSGPNSFAPTGHPRTRFAWGIVWAAGLLRINIAGLIGAGGYFFMYEWLYSHGPWPFRIQDPSPNGWKKAWREGQQCYAARAAASIFPVLGYIFYTGRLKRSGFWLTMTILTGLNYEYARSNMLSGSRLFYSYLANQEMDRQAAWGSLAPRLKHRVDPDTNRSESAAQFQHFRVTSGQFQDTVWANTTHATMPLHHAGIKIPNPYFNWQKAPQNYREKEVRVKNDMWEMPNVLNTQMLSGALD